MGMNEGYPISVPVMSNTVTAQTRLQTLEQIRQSGAVRVWIATFQGMLFSEKDDPDYRQLRENVEFFKSAGYEVGVWINSYGFGGPVPEKYAEKAKNWTRITALHQDEEPTDIAAFCPEDPEFAEAFCRQIRNIAELKPDLIMLDDDLCLSVRPGIGCFCHRHMQLLEEKTRQLLPNKDRLAELMFTYGKNWHRDIWLSVMKKTHIRFCTKLREALDEVDPTIRMGFCAGYTSWDIEGIDAITLTKILAGNTVPFLRLTSAPYWVTRGRNRFPGMKLNMVIEHARQQELWCRDSGVEIFNENDTSPRPRYNVPASYTECFDLATRASGGMGSLKYLIDYNSTPAYETGYIRLQKHNAPLAQQIETHFAGKLAEGIQIYRPMRTIHDAIFGERYERSHAGAKDVMRRVFAPEIAMLTQLSVPVTYETPDSAPEFAAAFGGDIRYVPKEQFPWNLIIDLPAARLLRRGGVDVGLLADEPAGDQGFEYFELPGHNPEKIAITYPRVFRPAYLGTGYFRCEVSPNVQIQSWFADGEGNRIPASYVYDNGTTRFLVLLADMDILGQSCSVSSSYARQTQILDFIHHAYPAIAGEPDIYTLYKVSDDGATAAVLFANIGEDMLFDFDIQLGKSCKSVKIFGAQGKLSDDGMSVHIDSDVFAKSCIALELSY